MKISFKIIEIVFVTFLLFSCKKKHITDGEIPSYDKRNISRNDALSGEPSMCVDKLGNVHVVWSDSAKEGNWEIIYRMKTSNGEWSDTENISNTKTRSICPKIAVDNNGNLHVVWEEWSETFDKIFIYYSMKKNGNWEPPYKISGSSPYNELPSISSDGYNVHVVYMNFDLEYVKKVGENWTTPIILKGTTGGMNPQIFAEKSGEVHIVYEDEPSPASPDIYYLYSPDGGNSWSEPLNISHSSYYSQLGGITGDKDGRIYVCWAEGDGNGLWISVKDTNGSWSNPFKVPGTVKHLAFPVILVNDDYEIFIFYSGLVELEIETQLDIFFTMRDKNGKWRKSVNISNTPGDSWVGRGNIGFLPWRCLGTAWGEVLTQNNYEVYYDEVFP